jgi:hypothetical protein
MKRMGRRLHALGLLVLSMLGPSGCGDDEHDAPTCTDWNVPRSPRPDVPLRRQTEHLDIYAEEFVCAGTALEFERHIDFVAKQFGLDLRTNIPVYLFDAPPEQCREGSTGCVPADGAVFAIPIASEHELAHSAACELRRNVQPAIAEGLAVMFEPFLSTQYGITDYDLREMLEAETTEDLSYSSAGHFARWLFERGGAETFAALYRRAHGRKHTIAAIEDLYGASLDELETEYFANAPYAWAPFRQCADLPHVEPDDDGVWRFSAMMDCEDESTMGPHLRALGDVSHSQLMSVSFTFTVDEITSLDYDLHGDIEQVSLERCHSEHPSTLDDVQGAVVVISTDPDAGFVLLPDLRPGTWRVNVLRVHGPPEPVGVALWDRY